jgi:hypothetical protein
MSATIRFYKDKEYFANTHNGQHIMARAACIVLRYVQDGETYTLTIRERADKNIVEFPGGKVEVGDTDIHDTVFREIWEEIILKDKLGEGNHKYLKNWAELRKDIVTSDEPSKKICHKIYKTLPKCQMVPYGSCALKIVYFIVNISPTQAKYLIDTHSMIPIPVSSLKHVVDFNNAKKGKGKLTTYADATQPRYRRKNTHFQSEGEIYKLRGRDFEGMFRFVPKL